MNRRDALGSLTCLTATPWLWAQDFPRAPISLITPLAAGDAADRAARLMGQELSNLLGVAVNVVNRPGAGGSLGTQSVIKAPKDGYTVLYAQNSPLTIRRVFEPEGANYDPLKDLIPIALTTRSPSVLAIRKDAPFKTLKDMLAYASKNNKTLQIGNAGPGSVGDIGVQQLQAMTGTQLQSVNYKGAAPAITDLLGGHIDGVILALGAMGSLIRNDTLRAIACSSTTPEFPNVPTLRQLGYPGNLLGIWFAFFMPAGTPGATVNVFAGALEKVVRNPELAAQLQPVGIVQEWRDAMALSDEISNEYKALSELQAKTAKPVK